MVKGREGDERHCYLYAVGIKRVGGKGTQDQQRVPHAQENIHKHNRGKVMI